METGRFRSIGILDAAFVGKVAHTFSNIHLLKYLTGIIYFVTLE